MTDYSGLVARLRAPIVSFEDNGSRRYQGLATEAAAAIEAQRERIERLEGALRKLTDPYQCDDREARDIARAALEAK